MKVHNKVKERESFFALRFRMGEYEVEVSGAKEEVLKTIEDLPNLAANIQKAFQELKPKTIAKITVKTEPTKEEPTLQKFPKIAPTEKCDEAILRVLESDWGKWRPRTINELHDALVANKLDFTGRVLSGALLGLVRKGIVRRWKTDADYVYILAEKEALAQKAEAKIE
ncbi:MAG: hypothetical protein ACP5IM_01350 [Candidatus Bathyarchaeia archaeon]|nr:MAG: hypothetical protein C0195_00020 [Candidatus Bathyarchaeota archaeon]